jgi:hypothetical protein
MIPFWKMKIFWTKLSKGIFEEFNVKIKITMACENIPKKKSKGVLKN